MGTVPETALLPATRCQSSGPLGALLSSPALDVRLMTALQVLQEDKLFFRVYMYTYGFTITLMITSGAGAVSERTRGSRRAKVCAN